MPEVLEGEIIEDAVRVPYELDGEKKLALVGLEANQMILVAHGLHLLVNALEHEPHDPDQLVSIKEFFHGMTTIAEEVRSL
ncbi:hypothetical protein AUR04nite_00800 [Glutamicibacter uratoxydans]|uniref:Uncharacterized protein n=1 Tax=Glutamicibacter uratoxydans TaxID=43667 RepID=A0A4Y4DMG8_GLUUR|nr:hypothetical protein [Glutamicibacter uratoxydans]GED04548.1 hypothetical protein AUR04nite_00800 [Glutamicibacter uratoxydans]